MQDEAEDILERAVPLDEDAAERARLKIRRRLPGRRLDKYLHARFPRLSRTLIQRLIRQGAVTVNGRPTKASYEPDAGDIVELMIPPPEPTEVIPEPGPLQILYEDNYILVLNKQPGIICHPAKGSQTGTLANSLAHYAGSLSHGDDPFRPGIVHRLDKNTTGVMVVAKTDEAHWRLALQFERRSVLKTYLGVVEKPVALDADIIDAPIAAHPRIKDRYLVPGSRLQADLSRQAVTRYEVVRRFRHYTLVRLYPKTGRTHQLRVHMSYIGHPLAGDRLYGGHCPSMRSLTGSGSDEPIIERQALHAWRIRFIHPVQERPFEIEAPLPDDLQDLIAVLERHEGG